MGLRLADSPDKADELARNGSTERFAYASQLMAYLGLVPSEHSSGKRERRGGHQDLALTPASPVVRGPFASITLLIRLIAETKGAEP